MLRHVRTSPGGKVDRRKLAGVLSLALIALTVVLLFVLVFPPNFGTATDKTGTSSAFPSPVPTSPSSGATAIAREVASILNGPVPTSGMGAKVGDDEQTSGLGAASVTVLWDRNGTRFRLTIVSTVQSLADFDPSQHALLYGLWGTVRPTGWEGSIAKDRVEGVLIFPENTLEGRPLVLKNRLSTLAVTDVGGVESRRFNWIP